MAKAIFIVFLFYSYLIFGQNNIAMKYITLHAIKTAEITEYGQTHTFHFGKKGNLVQWQIKESFSDMYFISEYDSLHRTIKILEKTISNSDTNKIEFFTYPQKNIVKTYGKTPTNMVNQETKFNLYFTRFCIYDSTTDTNKDSTVYRKSKIESDNIFNSVTWIHKYNNKLLRKSVILSWHSQYPTFIDSTITQYYFNGNELSKRSTYTIYHNKLTASDSIFFNKKGCFRLNTSSENKEQNKSYEKYGCPKAIKQIPFDYFFTSDNDLDYRGDGILYKAIKRKKLVVTATYK